MAQVDIAIPEPVMPVIVERLAPHFALHEVWRAQAPEAALAAVAPRVRGIAAGLGCVCDAAFIDRFPKLEIIASFGVGYDSIDAAHAGRRGVVVTNTPDVLTEEVADTCLGLVLMTVRELSAAERHLRAGRWRTQGHYPLTAGTLRGRTLGVFGLGRIGKAVARRAEAFGLAVAYHGRRRQPGVAYRYFDRLIDLARASDILVSVAPGGEPTRNAIDAAVLEALGPDGFLVSIGRGSVVDERALAAALREGVIRGAGLDVYADEPNVPEELVALENVVLLPHVGSASAHTRELMGRLVADNLIAWFSEGRALTPVPETPASVKEAPP